MIYPFLNELSRSRTATEVWQGFNHNLRIGDGEFYDMRNLSSDRYPVLAPRRKRGIYVSPTNAQGLIAKDTLCYIDGSAFVADGYRVDLGLSVAEADCPKRLISMGAYVIILPDKKYINTADITDHGNIEASVTTVGNVAFTLCRISGDTLSPDYIQESAPVDPLDGQLWLDIASDPNTLRQWNGIDGMWVSTATTYIKISSTGIGAAFREGDGVTISGLAGETLIGGNGEALENADVSSIDGNYIIQARGDDYLVIIGLLAQTAIITNPVTVSRKMPNMDLVIESENRLWGCRYGLNAAGEFVNELYASKLGDFRNFGCYMGLSTDSYTVSLGSDGVFTGACSYLGFPLFFKENCIHRVYGSYPAAYRLQTTQCRGVRKGSEKSLVMVGEVLYYHSATGICAYDGSLPMDVSQALGRELFHSAVAGTWRGKYYVSMADEEENHSLYVYDPRRGLWHREDDCRAAEFCACRGELFFIDHRDGAIKTVSGQGTPEEGPITWSATTGPIGAAAADHRYLRKLTLDVALAPGSTVTVEGAYDESPDFKRLGGFTADSFRRFTFPVRPRRCAVLRLRISGTGEGAVYGITRTTQKGSDVT